MPRPRLNSVFLGFQREVTGSISLLGAARTRGLAFLQIEQIAELCFLRIYLGWEGFLEDSFTRYMCGGRSISGFLPRRFAAPPSLAHARNMLIGLGGVRRYTDWTNPGTVIERANLTFKGGKPFATPLSAATQDLTDMRVVRNCIAHRSEEALAKFYALILRRLGVAYKFRPGRFLLRPIPGSPQLHIDYFADVVSILAQQLVR
jgi:hypothetical protein